MRNRLRSGYGVTLADVAQVAGVSAATASRALNGRGELSAETRAAVIEAAEALQFQPSLLARSLRTSTTYTVGFVVPDVSSPFYATALKGAQTAFEDAGYRVLLMDCEQSADREIAALETLLAHRVDGLLVSTVGVEPERYEQLVGRRGVPCVFFDSAHDGAGAASVLIDNDAGIELLVGHLVDHGHRSIALVSGSQAETSGRERRDAFLRTTAELGLAVNEDDVAGARWSAAEGRRATKQLLEVAERPTALVTASVELAIGAIHACRDLGLRIPDDVALATFDDAYFAGLLDPPLTTVAYDPAEVGRRAAALLVEAMGGADLQRRDVRVPVRLVTRRSCGCTS